MCIRDRCKQQAESVVDGCVRELRARYPPRFIDDWKAKMDSVHMEHLEEMKRFNGQSGYKEKKSFMKVISHYGACDCPDWSTARLRLFEYRCRITGLCYLDTGNYIYRQLILRCWPDSWVAQTVGEECAGDIIESMLAFGWKARVDGRTLGDKVTDLLNLISTACVHMWLVQEM